MEDSEMMTSSEITEVPEVETTTVQELTEELMTTELLTSTETTSETTTTVCLTYQNIEKLDVDMLNNFTYLGIFSMILIILTIAFKGVYGLFKIFF